MQPEIFIVATEASADMHAARVLEELRRIRPGLTAFGMGGAKLRAAGLESLRQAEEMSVMGVAEVLPKIPVILGILRELGAAAAARRPSVALLVDSPDFNLRLAEKLKRAGTKVVYYVSPSVWAWRRGRVKTIARVVDRMLCILPFEERFYEESGVSARFVGHPLAERPRPEEPARYREELGLAPGRTTIALLPGSRRSELKRIFPPMLEAAERIHARHPDAQFVVPVAPTLSEGALTPYLERHSALRVKLAPGRTEAAVGASDAALVKSGTSVLEAALMLRPMVVVYRLSWLSYLVARLFVRLAHFALVNLLAGRKIVPELLQRQASPERMAAEIERLLEDGHARAEQLRGLEEVRSSLGAPGAPRRVAEEVARLLPESPGPSVAPEAEEETRSLPGPSAPSVALPAEEEARSLPGPSAPSVALPAEEEARSLPEPCAPSVAPPAEEEARSLPEPSAPSVALPAEEEARSLPEPSAPSVAPPEAERSRGAPTTRS